MELVQHVRAVLVERGTGRYGGEALSQLEHALQTASLAEQSGAAAAMIVAALLHDLGHILPNAQPAAARGFEDGHESAGASFLAGWLGRHIAEPVRLHVAAKRYLCRVEPGYFDTLSQASRDSLAAQGGVFTPSQAEEFIAMPYAQEAVTLRRWDDGGKVPGATAPDLEHFLPIVLSCV